MNKILLLLAWLWCAQAQDGIFPSALRGPRGEAIELGRPATVSGAKWASWTTTLQTGSTVTASTFEGAISAHIYEPNGRVWELEAGVWREVQAENFSDFRNDMQTPRRIPEQTDSGLIAQGSDDGSVVDVLVVYSKAARESRGSVASMEALIRESVSQANLVLANSAVNLRVRLVGTAERDYPEAENLLTDLTRLTEPKDGFLDDIHALRNERGADLVSLFVASGGAPVCGLAWINRVQGPGFAPFGFSVVVQNCAVAGYGFAHEVGHNLGAAHDPENSNGPGMFPYSYGFRRSGSLPAFRDIMSAPCASGCPPVPLYSNSIVRVAGAVAGAPPADANPADNARTINAARTWVAGFRDSVAESAVSPDQVEVPSAGLNGSVKIAIAGSWSASVSDSWIRILSSASGSGPGTLRFAVAANPSLQERSAFIAVANELVLVRQAGSGCEVEVTAPATSVPGYRSYGSVEVAAAPACSWVTAAETPWLSVRTPLHISGSRTLVFEAEENPTDKERTGTIRIGSTSVNITQLAKPAACDAIEVTPGRTATEQLDFASCHSAFAALDSFAARFAFVGTAGNHALITTSSPAFTPTITLVAPDGTRLRSETGTGPGRRAALARTGSIMLPATGRYLVEVSDAGATRQFGKVHVTVRTGANAVAGPAALATFQDGEWLADLNGDRTWQEGDDLKTSFGQVGDMPVLGDWDGSGHRRIAVFRSGEWLVDLSGNLEFLGRDDETYRFGRAGDYPVVADWDGSGRDRAGVFRDGEWIVDSNGDFQLNAGADATFRFGQAGDIPVVGDWDGTGRVRVGVFRAGEWLLDMDGNREWNPLADRRVSFGQSGDVPVLGDWDGSGKSKIGVFRDGQWLLDLDGDQRFDEATDLRVLFGKRGDRPVPATW